MKDKFIKHLLEYEPLITDPKFGREPNIIDLIERYYQCHGMENWEELRDQYIEKLVECCGGEF